ncbi:hypothetical protein Aoki45_17350 [Algoriphagus sp. oki45]|uniref:serine hydrolase domain-containing protein n=1 Tax=Algoriphagus sp. oki45 TaxID=3067294 RepID=UPI0027F5E8F3|nr:hypothetical protein Aoki45_17350 [Algoriphagus sp. oki45]
MDFGKITPFFILIFIESLFLSCKPLSLDPSLASAFPQDNWEKVSYLEVGLDSIQLEKALDYLASQSYGDGVSEVVIVRNGRVVFQGDSVTKSHNIYSCTKGFTSLVMGLLEAEGRLSIRDKVYKTLPELESGYAEVTWEHFATMTSGYSGAGISRWNEENSDWSWTPYSPEAPHFTPGSHYEYWDEAQMMFGKGLTTLLNGSMKSYLDQKIMSPIGIDSWSWASEQALENGIAIQNGCTGISLNALDAARVGLLFLNQGKWEGKQLIPEEFVKKALSAQVAASVPVYPGDRASVKGSGSYGYNWWVNSTDGLSRMPDAPLGVAYLSGLNHNIILVVPEWNMLLVRLGDDKNPDLPKHVVWNEFLRLVGEALIDS